MTDPGLEERLRAWYAAQADATEAAPPELRAQVTSIPRASAAPRRLPTRRRDLGLLAAAAVLIVGGAVAAGAGWVRLPAVEPPPSNALLATSGPSPSETPPATPSQTAPAMASGGLIAFTRGVDKGATCVRADPCLTPRLWIAATDGSGAHEVFANGDGRQVPIAWSPDGAHLLYVEGDAMFVTDPTGSDPKPLDTGCAAASAPLCLRDAGVRLSRDGRAIVFQRDFGEGSSVIATMDLASGRVELIEAARDGVHPDWSPDGRQIVFWRPGDKDSGGPFEPTVSSIWIVDVDGEHLRQVSPATHAAESPEWSPDGERIAFVVTDGEHSDIYTIRSDGSDVRQLTTDGQSFQPTWTPDGRLLYMHAASPAGWWTMDAAGGDAADLVRVDALEGRSSWPVWQPVGGPPIPPPPWTPATPVAVGSPVPTPVPTPIPSLAPGFTLTASLPITDPTAFDVTATRLGDGRVLIVGGCSTTAQIYDPSSGTFTQTGSLAKVRAGATSTLLRDGHVLVAGGYDCGRGGQDGIWASAELYDPGTGTFSATASMAAPREQHTATLLTDGRVLIAGGLTGPAPAVTGSITLASYRTADTDAGFLATAELYDPATGHFSKTGSMSRPHRGHTATLLADGRVLVAGNGGEASNGGTAADVYDPGTGTFSRTGSMKSPRWLHTATLLPDGRVLIVGGRSPKDAVYTSAESYDPRSGTFSRAGSMDEGRQQHTATLLQDGRVLVAGGYWSDGQGWRVLSSTEMYDPSSDTFRPIGSMGPPREGHSAPLLDDGRVLIVGGSDIGRRGAVGVPWTVLYQP